MVSPHETLKGLYNPMLRTFNRRGVKSITVVLDLICGIFYFVVGRCFLDMTFAPCAQWLQYGHTTKSQNKTKYHTESLRPKKLKHL